MATLILMLISITQSNVLAVANDQETSPTSTVADEQETSPTSTDVDEQATSSTSEVVDDEISSSEWVAPIGIPYPPFGLDETYRMYDDPDKRNKSLTYYESSSGGYYTHYIDSTDPNSTDSGNDYGTKATPRKSIPRGSRCPPAGSIVEVHNSMNDNAFSNVYIGGEGTADMPIFIRGVNDPNVEMKISVGYYDNSSYLIIEGIKFNKGSISYRDTAESFETNNICFRRCEFASYDYTESAVGGFSIGGKVGSSNQTYNAILYDCSIHDNGPLDAEKDYDKGGVAIKGNCSYVWVLNCVMYNNSYNGVQVGGTTSGTDAPDHVYIGRNVAYHNRQSGLWSKTAYDVIFSQNICYEPLFTTSAGLGFQYDCKRVWYLFNIVYNAEAGFKSGSTYSGEREEIYFIGNIVHNCNNAVALVSPTKNGNCPIIFNTIYNCDWGIGAYWFDSHSFTNGNLLIYNNIVANCNYGIVIGSIHGATNDSSMDNCLFYNNNYLKWGSDYASLLALQAGTDQGDNCIENNPLFVDPVNSDFNLQGSSPVDNLKTSSQVQVVFDRFLELYKIDLGLDIEGRGGNWEVYKNTSSTSSAPKEEAIEDNNNDNDTDTDSSDQDSSEQNLQEEGISEPVYSSSGRTERKVTSSGIISGFSTKQIFERYDLLYNSNRYSRTDKEYYE